MGSAIGTIRNTSAAIDSPEKTDTRAMAVTTALFFMVGFLTCLNDVIIPHLKSIFEAEALCRSDADPICIFFVLLCLQLSGRQSCGVAGYKRCHGHRLAYHMSAGALGFLPAANYAAFPLFLAALVVLAAGMTTVQVAANPYVTIIGPAATASSRLNLGQAFNSVGTFIAPFFGSILILRGAKPIAPERLHNMAEAARQTYRTAEASSVRIPYIAMALVLFCLALALSLIKLNREQSTVRVTRDFRPGELTDTATTSTNSIWNHPRLLAGALGIFTYVGVEVAIGSLLVSFMGLPEIAGFREARAADFLMVYWGGAMMGRFIGSAILQHARTGPILGWVALIAFCLVTSSVLLHGHVAMFALASGRTL